MKEREEWNWNKTFILDKFPGKFVRLKVDTFYDYKPIWEWFVKTAGLFQFILYNYIMKLSLVRRYTVKIKLNTELKFLLSNQFV